MPKTKWGPKTNRVKRELLSKLKAHGIATMADLKAAIRPHAIKHGWDMSSGGSSLTSQNLKKAINCGFIKDRRKAVQKEGNIADKKLAAQARDKARNSQTYHMAEVALATVLGRHASQAFGDIHYTNQPHFDEKEEKFIKPDLSQPEYANADPYEETLRDIKLSKVLERAMEKLKPREERALRIKFGLSNGSNYGRDCEWQFLGQQGGMSVSQERARQITAKAVRKLRRNKELQKAYGKKADNKSWVIKIPQ